VCVCFWRDFLVVIKISVWDDGGEFGRCPFGFFFPLYHTSSTVYLMSLSDALMILEEDD
jgi:hypothetical protein